MRKIFSLILLLGLMGCVDNDQSNTSQANLNPVEQTAPTATSYNLSTSSRTMSAALPFGGWSVTSSTAVGASTLIDAAKS
ncbi:MAG: hypothetical protein RSB22_07525 [Acinetobacter sp.]